jgi:hypothetical protein
MAPPVRLGPRSRRIVERFAGTVCPPEARSRDLLPPLLDEVERFLGAWPPHVRRAVVAGFLAFDEAARVHRAGRGRRFVELDDEAADTYYRARAASRSPAVRNVVKLMRGLVAMSYYELPAVHDELDYHPEAYIGQVARRRLEVHGDDVRRGERAVFLDPAPDRA